MRKPPISKKKKAGFFKYLLLSAGLFSFIFFSGYFLTLQHSEAQELKCDDYGDKDLSVADYDKIIAICDAEIEEEKKKLQEKQKQTSGVRNEIKNLDRKIKISQAYINRKIARANKLKRDMGKNKEDIKKLEEKLEKTTKNLSALLYKKAQVENYSSLEAILSSNTLSEFFQDLQTLDFIEKSMAGEIESIKKEKEDLEELALELQERESVERQLAEEKRIEAEKIRKNKEYKKTLLAILKKEEGKSKEKITNKEKIKLEILKKKYRTVGGEEIEFGEALKLLEPYSKILKMDPAFVLAILFQESGWKGKIGGNIGKCLYNQKNSHGRASGGYTVMKNSQKKNFLKIMQDLKMDPNKTKVSCPIPKDGAYGGAMGPAQFMPNTWMAVRSRVAKVLSLPESTISPFSNQHSFIASAIYLKDHYYGRDCSSYANKYKHIVNERTLRERCAASKYYAGKNWWKFRFKYGESVVKRADRFRRDIAILNE